MWLLPLHVAPRIRAFVSSPILLWRNFEAGLSAAEIHRQFPSVASANIRTVLNDAAKLGRLSRTVR